MARKYTNWRAVVAGKVKSLPESRVNQGCENDAMLRQRARAYQARQRRESVSAEVKQEAAQLSRLPEAIAYEFCQHRLLEAYQRILQAAIDYIPYAEAERRFPDQEERYAYLAREETAATAKLLARENEFLYWRERCAERVGKPVYVPYRVYHGSRQHFPWPEVRGEGEETGDWCMGLYVTPMPATADNYARSLRGDGAAAEDLPRIVYGDLDLGALDFEGFIPKKRSRDKSIAEWLYHDLPVSGLGPIIDPTHHRHNAYILPSVKAETSFQPLGEYIGKWSDTADMNDPKRRYTSLHKLDCYARADGEKLPFATSENWDLFSKDPKLALREWQQRYASPEQFRKEQAARYAQLYAQRLPVIAANRQERIREAFFEAMPFRPDPEQHRITLDYSPTTLPKGYYPLQVGERGRYFYQRQRIPYIARIITRGKNRGDRLIYHCDNLKKPLFPRLKDRFDDRQLVEGLMPLLQAEYDRLAAAYKRRYGAAAGDLYP